MIRGRGRRNYNRRPRHPASGVRVDFGALQVPYSDEDAELEIKSIDGVVFKVRGFYLKAASGVFRDMLDSSAAQLPTPVVNRNISATVISTGSATEPKSPQPPIEISSSSLVVRLFVDLMYGNELLDTFTQPLGPAPTPAEVLAAQALPSAGLTTHFTDIFRTANSGLIGKRNGVACLAELLELLDRFDCTVQMRRTAMAHFASTYDCNPWTVFVIAARYDDLHLAKLAIEKFAAIQKELRWKVQPDTLRTEDGGKLPLPWLMGYLRAHAQVTGTQAHLGTASKDSEEKFWKNVAAAFTTVTPEPPTLTKSQIHLNVLRSLNTPAGPTGA